MKCNKHTISKFWINIINNYWVIQLVEFYISNDIIIHLFLIVFYTHGMFKSFGSLILYEIRSCNVRDKRAIYGRVGLVSRR